MKVQKTEEDKGNHAVLRKIKNVEVHLVYYIDKGLSGIPAQTADHPNFRLVREDCLNEGGDFVCGEGKAS